MKTQEFAKIYHEGQIRRGDKIRLPVDLTRRYEISSKISGLDELKEHGCSQIFEGDETGEMSWKFLTEQDGTLVLIGDVTSFSVKFAGKKGYYNGPEQLDDLCMALYGIPEYGIVSRNIKDRDNRILMEKDFLSNRIYWLSSRTITLSSYSDEDLCIHVVNSGRIRGNYACYKDGKTYMLSYAARPLLYLPMINRNIRGVQVADNVYEIVLK